MKRTAVITMLALGLAFPTLVRALSLPPVIGAPTLAREDDEKDKKEKKEEPKKDAAPKKPAPARGSYDRSDPRRVKPVDRDAKPVNPVDKTPDKAVDDRRVRPAETRTIDAKTTVEEKRIRPTSDSRDTRDVRTTDRDSRVVNKTEVNKKEVNTTEVNRKVVNTTVVNRKVVNTTVINRTVINETHVNRRFVERTYYDRPVFDSRYYVRPVNTFTIGLGFGSGGDNFFFGFNSYRGCSPVYVERYRLFRPYRPATIVVIGGGSTVIVGGGSTVIVEPEPVVVIEPQPVLVIEPDPVVVIQQPIYRQWYRPEPMLIIASGPVYRPRPVVVASSVPLYSALYTPAPVVVVDRTPTAVVEAEPAPREGVTIEGEVRFQYNR
jgi:hypothetical protein